MEDPPPKRTPWHALLLCVCSGSALLGDLLGVSRSRECDLLSVLSIYPRIFLCVTPIFDRKMLSFWRDFVPMRSHRGDDTTLPCSWNIEDCCVVVGYILSRNCLLFLTFLTRCVVTKANTCYLGFYCLTSLKWFSWYRVWQGRRYSDRLHLFTDLFLHVHGAG